MFFFFWQSKRSRKIFWIWIDIFQKIFNLISILDILFLLRDPLFVLQSPISFQNWLKIFLIQFIVGLCRRNSFWLENKFVSWRNLRYKIDKKAKFRGLWSVLHNKSLRLLYILVSDIELKILRWNQRSILVFFDPNQSRIFIPKLNHWNQMRRAS